MSRVHSVIRSDAEKHSQMIVHACWYFFPDKSIQSLAQIPEFHVTTRPELFQEVLLAEHCVVLEKGFNM